MYKRQVYAAFLFGQVVRHVLKTEYGVHVLSWDEARGDLPRARRQMAHLMRGGGGPNPNMGVELRASGPEPVPSEIQGAREEREPKHASLDFNDAYGERLGDPPKNLEWGITELAAREIELSYAGGCDAVLTSDGNNHWLESIRPVRQLGLDLAGRRAAGRNVFIMVDTADIAAAAQMLASAHCADPSTRGVLVCKRSDEEEWRRRLECCARVTTILSLGGPRSVGGASPSELLTGLEEASVLSFGERAFQETRGRLDRDQVGSLMDPLDLGIGALPKRWKSAVSFSPYPELKIEQWEGLSLIHI